MSLASQNVKKDPRFSSVAAKEAHWNDLLALIEKWTRERTGAECESALMTAGVPCSRYRTVAEAMQDPQVKERGFLTELGEGDGTFKVANAPYLMSATPTHARSTLAMLGEHSDAILQEKLGLNSDDIVLLRKQGVLG